MTEVPYFLDRIRTRVDVRAAFVERVAGVDVAADKDEVVSRLEPFHAREVERLGFGVNDLWLAEQVHGGAVAVVPGDSRGPRRMAGVDALVAAGPGVLLGIHVADCGAIFMVDGRSGALGLAHSGKKGTEANILGATVARMAAEFGTRPADLWIALGPCIRPPAYEVDFAAEIGRQAQAAGVPASQYCDSGECTTAAPERFYSYRLEMGKTGRMLALLGRVAR
jgi:copper oxidase (laccase) domain-containing protein